MIPVTDSLLRCALFDGIEADDLAGMLDCLGARRAAYARGEVILAEGAPADLVILNTDREITVDANAFASKGRNTPFHGKNYFGAVCATMVGGRVIFEEA